MGQGTAGYLRRHGLDMDRGNIPNFTDQMPNVRGVALPITFFNIGEIPISVNDMRVWNSFAALLPAAAATDDLGLIDNTFGTAAPTIQTIDAKAAGTTAYARFQYVMPFDVREITTMKLRINAGMKTTIADTSTLLDVIAYRNAAPTVDLNTTAATDINSLTAADKDFTLTITNLAIGDVLDIRISIVIVDAATGTAVIGKINDLAMIFT